MLEHWYDALSQPLGIVLEVVSGDIEAARQALYKVRRESGDESLSGLSVRINPLAPDRELFLMKAAKR